MSNPHEQYFRAVKANKLALVIQRAVTESGAGITPDALARELTDADWHAFARVAGVHPPSPTTQAEVIRLLTPAPTAA